LAINSLGVKMEFVVGIVSLLCELYSLSWSSFRSCWGQHNRVREMLFRFTCAVLLKLHG